MKKRIAAFAGISALVLLGGCVTAPDGPTVPVMPAKGKPFAQFEREDAECQDFAHDRTAGAAKRANDKAVTTALIGTALGAGLGAAIGGGRGAGIGAASGAVVGTAAGARRSSIAGMGIQQQYDVY